MIMSFLSWQAWTMIGLVALIILILEDAYRKSPKKINIEVIYDHVKYPDCRKTYGNDLLFRVGLRNNSNIDIDRVKVYLRVLDPSDPYNVGEQLLKLKDDRLPFNDTKQGVRITPSKTPTVFVDVGFIRQDDTFQLCYVLDDIPLVLPSPPNQYRFSIRIEGPNALPVSKIFHIEPSEGIIFEE